MIWHTLWSRINLYCFLNWDHIYPHSAPYLLPQLIKVTMYSNQLGFKCTITYHCFFSNAFPVVLNSSFQLDTSLYLHHTFYTGCDSFLSLASLYVPQQQLVIRDIVFVRSWVVFSSWLRISFGGHLPQCVNPYGGSLIGLGFYSQVLCTCFFVGTFRHYFLFLWVLKVQKLY